MNPSILAPSRYHLAIFRLSAVLRLRSRTQEADSGNPRFLSFEKGQSRVEVYLFSAIFFVLWEMFLLATIQRFFALPVWAIPVTLIVLVPVTFLVIEAHMFAFGFLLAGLERIGSIPRRPHTLAQERFHYLTMHAFSILAIFEGGWVRWPGAIWLALAVINWLAAVALALMPATVRNIEDRFGESRQVLPFQKPD